MRVTIGYRLHDWAGVEQVTENNRYFYMLYRFDSDRNIHLVSNLVPGGVYANPEASKMLNVLIDEGFDRIEPGRVFEIH